MTKNPEVIVIFSMNSGSGIQGDPSGLLQKWRDYPKLKAVQASRVFQISGDRILRPTLGLLEGIAEIEKTLFP